MPADNRGKSDIDAPGPVVAAVFVVIGFLFNGGFGGLWFLFGGAGAGNDGKGDKFMDAMLPAAVVFGICLLLSLALLIWRKYRSALFIAWTSGVLGFAVFALLFY
jgi:hypothetical protein